MYRFISGTRSTVTFGRRWRICKKATIVWISNPESDEMRHICLVLTKGKALNKVLVSRLVHYLEIDRISVSINLASEEAEEQ